MAVKGIAGRWIINSLVIMCVILTIIMMCAFVLIRSYYYNGIQQSISGNAAGASGYLSGYTNTTSEFNSNIRLYVESFEHKEQMELMAFDHKDNLLITSTGFQPDINQGMPDYEMAKKSGNGYVTWVGRLNSGEKVMAATKVMYTSNGEYVGAARYIVSLESADRVIVFATLIILLIGLIVIIIMIISNTYFIRSMTKPLAKITSTTRSIAGGNLSARIENPGKDEIGELSRTINDMATELDATDKMKNEFISSISHELRTPLTAIKGWAETMKMGGITDPGTMEKGMSIIINETGRLSSMVEELLDFSRMQNNALTLMLEKIDILAELNEAVYIYTEGAIKENKHLVFEVPDMLPFVMGDKNRLRQVFINIIDNAIKYTPDGGIINITTKVDKEMVHIVISDNGCGIPTIHMPKIKEKFYKANQSKRGSGIGLAVANEIIIAHCGALNIESEEGIGTTVVISIPKIHSNDNLEEA
jgi:signal transduction histidine kinase